MRGRQRVVKGALKVAGFVAFVGTMYAAIIVGLVHNNFGGQNVQYEKKQKSNLR